jgi:3-methyladenine DNA glycosylase AlkD
VDAPAEHIVGAHREHAKPGVLDRIAIRATFHWIERGEFDPTIHVAQLLLQDRHDPIHKAVGWMLREVGKRDRPVEEVFLRRHDRTRSRVMLRYALEHFPRSDGRRI